MSAASTSKTPAKTVSSVTTRQAVEDKSNIHLVGRTTHQITGAKLPSNRQVLQVFFHNLRFVKLDKYKSADLTIDSVLIFWKQAHIPTRGHNKCAEKLVALYQKLRNFGRTKPSRRSDGKVDEVQEFVDKLDDLFDIASANALEQMKIEEDKQFLEMQRLKGRPKSMIGVDMALYEREKRSQIRKEKQFERQKKHEEEMTRKAGNKIEVLLIVLVFMACSFQYYAASTEYVGESDDESNLEMPSLDSIDDDDDFIDYTAKSTSPAKRGRVNFITDRLLAALDMAKVSSRMAMHILVATAEALGHRVEQFALNHRTIHNMRHEYRFKQFDEIATDFNDNVILKIEAFNFTSSSYRFSFVIHFIVYS